MSYNQKYFFTFYADRDTRIVNGFPDEYLCSISQLNYAGATVEIQAQQNPMQAYNQLNALVRGFALPGTTTTQYQASPNLLTQGVGAGVAGLGLYNAMNPGTKS